MRLLEDQGVLVTGGTGSFARAFIPDALRQGARRIVCLGRHEGEMRTLEDQFGPGDHDQMRYYLGDVRDQDRLRTAMHGIDIVIHAAALKRIEQCQRDAFECLRTNVVGSMNVVQACLDTEVRRCILLSTDKAFAPVNVYGASKRCAEELFRSYREWSGGRCAFGTVRYGNIWGSRGSVVRQWRTAIACGFPIAVTDPEATRFFMTVQQAVNLVQRTLHLMSEGPTGIAIPDLPAYRLGDLITALGDPPSITIGLPEWEKRHETMDGVIYSDKVQRMSVPELKQEIDKL